MTARRFLEGLFRYWAALLGLVVVCVAVSGVIVYNQPRTYQASTSLWFQTTSLASDASVGGAPTVGNTSLTPADEAVGFLNELLKTRKFCIDIGHKGPLATELATRVALPADASPTLKSQLLDDNIESTLQTKTQLAAAGPELVTITFDDQDAQVAAGTLKALVDELSRETVSLALAQADRQVTFYGQQVPDLQKQSDSADAAVAAYFNAHPELAVPQPPPDATLAGLQAAANQAHQQLGAVLQNLSQARAIQQGIGTSGQAAYRVIDAPEVPHTSVSRVKPVLLGVGMGLAVGLAFSLLGLVLLTRIDTSIHSADDVEQPLGLRTIGSVPLVHTSSPGRRGKGKRFLGSLFPLGHPG